MRCGDGTSAFRGPLGAPSVPPGRGSTHDFQRSVQVPPGDDPLLGVVQDAIVTDQRSDIERAYREHRERLWRALLAFTGDPDVASDALAEAFAQLIARGGEVRSPDGWVWTTAFRVAAGEMGRRRTSAPLGSEPSYELPDPVDHLVRALASIPSAQRLAVVLHDYADRPTDEVAAVLGVTRATVHVHLSRGRKRLRQLLGDQTDG